MLTLRALYSQNGLSSCQLRWHLKQPVVRMYVGYSRCVCANEWKFERLISRWKQSVQMSGTVMLADVLTVHVNNAWRHKQWCTLNCSSGVLITHCVRVCDFCMSADRERSSAPQRESRLCYLLCVCVCGSCVGRCSALRWAVVLMEHDSSNFFLTPTEKPKRRSPSLYSKL